MKNLCKGLLVAVAAVSCGIMTAPKASADVLIQDTTTWPATIDYSMSDPIVLSEPAVIEDTQFVAPTVVTSPAVITSPTVVNTTPVIMNDDAHLLHLGLPFIDFSLF
jgi:hypothetical protein